MCNLNTFVLNIDLLFKDHASKFRSYLLEVNSMSIVHFKFYKIILLYVNVPKQENLFSKRK
jgi:hypothetical protein